MTRRVFVTGMGVVSSVGLGRAAYWQALCAGQSGASDLELFDASELGRTIACEVKGFEAADHLTRAEQLHTGRCSAMAVAATRMAVEDAGLGDGVGGERTAVVLGTTMGEVDVISRLQQAWLHEGEQAVAVRQMPQYGTRLLAVHVARAVGARGMLQTLPAACAAGNYALGFAADQIRAGRADVAISGASEILDKVQFSGFVRLAAMSPDRCTPFDKERKGLLLGEGAAMLVLESEESVVKRGATPLAELGGYGLACDAHHITRPHPEGEGSIFAMREAIASSGIRAQDVDFVNAHGTGTAANDKVESAVVHEVFGGRRVPVSSIKSMLGHCMGAASALEAVSCVETVQSGVLPPTTGYVHPDPECDVDVVANAPREAKADIVLNNALAFGGYDAVLCLARPGVLPEPGSRGEAAPAPEAN